MGVKVMNPESLPTLVYENMHLDELRIRQGTRAYMTDPAVYEVLVEYRMYAEDPDGKLHYHNKRHNIYLKDYLVKAFEKASQGDMDMLNAFFGIEAALTVLIVDQGVHGAAEVV